MADESILNYRRPGFPKFSYDDKSYKTVIEYIGPAATLSTASPPLNSAWGNYLGIATVEGLDLIEGSDYGVLTVTCERKYEFSPNPGTRRENETTYEIDWVDVPRSLYEHPAFMMGGSGTYELTAEDICAIKLWDVEPNLTLRKDYKYSILSASGEATESVLSDNAKMFAKGMLLSIDHWVDKAPVARRSDTWVNGPPPAGTAGQKQEPTGFPDLPTGYEWIRSADRALRAGGQASWTSTTEWIGTDHVLVDVDEVYWTAP